MAELVGKAVSELPEATEINDADLFVLSQNGESKKTTKQTLLSEVTNGLLSVIRVGSFNVGCFSNGQHDLATAISHIAEMADAWRMRIGQIDCDILCCQEVYEYVDANNTVPAMPIFSFKYPYINHTQTNGNYIFSKFEPSGYTNRSYANESLRYYQWETVTICGKTIYIVNTHVNERPDPSEYRQAQIAELITFLTGKTFIACGDFNAYSTSEFDAFTTAGFKIANHGDFGDFATWPKNDSSWTNSAIDNIITSADISIQNVGIDFRALQSDHAFFYADLKIV